MEPMSVLLAIWAMLTAALVVVMIYRTVLTMHEDDQLFLDNAESHLEKEQQQLMQRMNQTKPFVTVLGTSSGLLMLLMAGLWIWRGWNRF
jgi:6-phosphogluconate dehydrogenase (decarboxylating)